MAFEIPAKPQRDRWLDLKKLRLAMDDTRQSITEGRKVLAMPNPKAGIEWADELATLCLDLVKDKLAGKINLYTMLCALRAHHRGRTHVTRVRTGFVKGSLDATYEDQRNALQACGVADHFLPTPGEQHAPAGCAQPPTAS